jgi:hypothetical protein
VADSITLTWQLFEHWVHSNDRTLGRAPEPNPWKALTPDRPAIPSRAAIAAPMAPEIRL